MRKIQFLGAVLLGVVLAPGDVCAALADVAKDYGFRRAAFLARGMGARPVAMGEAFTAVADDASAISWNPGGLGRCRQLQATAMYDAAGNDLGLMYAAASAPLGPGVAAAGITAINYGEYELRSDDGTMMGNDSAMDLALAVSYAVKNPSWLGGFTGVAIEHISEAVGGSLIGFSLGGILPLAPGQTFGWSLMHVGPDVDGFSLPAVARCGIAVRSSPKFGAAVDAGYGFTDRKMLAAIGAEYEPLSMVALRAGYKLVGAGEALSGLTGLTVGAGFKFGNVGLDYAFQPFGDMALSHRVALRYGFGPSRTVQD